MTQVLPDHYVLRHVCHDMVQLTCYGLYKVCARVLLFYIASAACFVLQQATVGNVNTERPSMFNFVEKSKWNAWKSREGMSSEQAMQDYIKEIDAQRAKYGE